MISWTAPEFVHYPKEKWWFAAVAAAGIILVGYFLLRKDLLTAALFLLLLPIIYYFSRAKPRTLNIKLDGRGLKINEQQISYQQIRNFWIVYEPPHVKTLNFETAAYLNRYVTLQLENEDPLKIRQFLLEYLPEDLDRGEQFADKLSRTLKF